MTVMDLWAVFANTPACSECVTGGLYGDSSDSWASHMEALPAKRSRCNCSNVTAERRAAVRCWRLPRACRSPASELGLTLSEPGRTVACIRQLTNRPTIYFSSALDSFRCGSWNTSMRMSRRLSITLEAPSLRTARPKSMRVRFVLGINSYAIEPLFASDDVRQAPPFQSLAMLEILEGEVRTAPDRTLGSR